MVDGIEFDSDKEAKRWIELQRMLKDGMISKLQRQVPFELIPSQTLPFPRLSENGRAMQYTEQKMTYKADFVYNDIYGHRVIEDVKGYKGGSAYETYKIKRKLMLYRYGIQIKEV